MSLPSTMKAVSGVTGSAVALLATATTPEQVIACALSGLSDAATWLVPNDETHPRWYRRAAKACVSATGVGLAAVPLALGKYEGAQGVELTVHGLLLQLDSADWQTLGILAARTALVALLANGPDERVPAAADEPEVRRAPVDLDPAALSDDPLPPAPAGLTLTGMLDAVPAEPARLSAAQAAALAVRPDRHARRASRAVERQLTEETIEAATGRHGARS